MGGGSDATADQPFINREELKDRNFLICTVFGFFINMLLFATLALPPPMLESLMGSTPRPSTPT